MQKDLSRINEIIEEIETKSADGDCIFRGEPECYENVSSSLYRNFKQIAQVGIETLQKQLLYQAEAYDVNRLGPSQSQQSIWRWSGGYNPLEYSERQFEMLSELQHWGGETNLIDFTTDYRIALFFACDISHDKDGRIIVQDRAAVEDIIWKPTEPRHRVEAQASVFIQPSDGFIQPDPEKVIRIPKALKVPVLKYLTRQSPPITTETLYNDLHGFISMQKRYRRAFVRFYVAVDYEKQGDAAETLRQREEAYEKADNYYKRAIQLMPNLVLAHINCGVVHGKLVDFDSAIHHFREAIDWKPDYVDSYYNLGYAYYFKEEFGAAMASYDTAIELNPDFAPAYSGRAQVKCCTGEFSLAIEDCTKAIDLKPDKAELYYGRGVVWLYLKQWEKAKSDLMTARQKGMDVHSFFHSGYSGIEGFERKHGVELPEDIAAMLTP